MCRPGHPLTKLSRVTIDRLLQYPVVSTPLSDELARVLVERYGHSAHPDEMVRLTSDEISHLIDVTRQSDAILLAIRASAPALHELPVTPALNANARFALVTLAGRSHALALPDIRHLMASLLREPSSPKANPKPKRKP